MDKKTADMRLEIPSDPSKRWEWIKYQLKLKNTSLAALGKQDKSSRQAPQLVKTRHYPKWENIIAQSIGLLPHQIWPERYSKYADLSDKKNKSVASTGGQQ